MFGAVMRWRTVSNQMLSIATRAATANISVRCVRNVCLCLHGVHVDCSKPMIEFDELKKSEMSVFDRPTLEEIRSWGKSFDKLMRSPAGRKVFRDFLRCEYSEENILFWLACEELKVETNAEKVEEKARFIYEDYISILSPKEVSIFFCAPHLFDNFIQMINHLTLLRTLLLTFCTHTYKVVMLSYI